MMEAGQMERVRSLRLKVDEADLKNDQLAKQYEEKIKKALMNEDIQKTETTK